MAKFQLFQNTERKHFSLGFFFPEVGNSGLKAYNVREKEQFCKYFPGIFEILENILFFLTSSRKVSLVEFLVREKAVEHISSIALNKESGYLPKFSV